MKKLVFFLITSIISVVLLAPASIASTKKDSADSFKIKEINYYFPMHVGARWEYNISIPKGNDILTFQIKQWQSGNKTFTYRMREKIKVVRDASKFKLIIKVKQIVTKKQNYYRFPLSKAKVVELDIERDDLGLYNDAEQVFWIYFPDKKIVFEITTSAVEQISNKNRTNIISKKVIFFENDQINKKNTVTIDKDRIDSLILLDNISYTEQGKKCLFFVRIVKEYKDNKSFKEIKIYCEGKGLVSFDQQYEGKTIMSLELQR